MNIYAAYRQVGTYRGAAEMCGTTHKTVKRVIERVESGGDRPVREPREANYEVVRDLVANEVKDTKAKISAKRLLPGARAAGYAGSERNFRRLVAAEKRAWWSRNAAGRRPGVWSPGEHLVIDWGVLAGVHVFCAVLAWSRIRFVRFAADETAATTMRMLAECFETLGGVPRVVLADRMGCLKGGTVANRVIPTPDFVRFASHYRFRPDFCEAADPQSKGIVENLVGYGKDDLLLPLLLELAPPTLPGPAASCPSGQVRTGVDRQKRAAAMILGDLSAANQRAVAWCEEVNSSEHSEICAVPNTRLASEVELLGPLPSLRPWIGPAPVLRKVTRLSTIRFGSAVYSVPTSLIGAQVAVVVDGPRLIILDPDTALVHAEHPVVAPGTSSVLDEHYGGPRSATPARTIRPRSAAEKQFCSLGEVAQRFIAGAAAAGHTRLGPELTELNTLAAAHGTEAMLAALERAIAFSRWRAADIASILAAGAGTPTPTAVGEALILDLPTAPKRSLTDYTPTQPAPKPVETMTDSSELLTCEVVGS